MKAATVIAAALAAGGCAHVAPSTEQDEGAITITVQPARVAQCQEQGGCMLVSQAEVLELARRAYEVGAEAAGCRKGRI